MFGPAALCRPGPTKKERSSKPCVRQGIRLLSNPNYSIDGGELWENLLLRQGRLKLLSRYPRCFALCPSPRWSFGTVHPDEVRFGGATGQYKVLDASGAGRARVGKVALQSSLFQMPRKSSFGHEPSELLRRGR